MNKSILILLAALSGFWIIFLCLQSPAIYNNTLGLIAKNWQNENGERKLVHKPYDKLTNENYTQWDGLHYFNIKKDGYKVEKPGHDFIFAFFPLFPAIWSISHLPPVGILFLNYLFFSIAVLILINLFSASKNFFINAALSLCLPGLVIFFMPYTEAAFMLMVSIGIYGFYKKSYRIFFVGFLLAALTRPSFTFLLLSIIGAEFFFFIKHKQIKTGLVNTLYRIAPLLIGTLIVSFIQYLEGSGSVFKFFEVQKYWKDHLSVPHNLRDWSQLGFSINIGIIFLLFIPLTVLFFQLLYGQLSSKKKTRIVDYKSPKDYLLILSILFLIGNCLFIILFRGGNLRCMFRYTICTPFIYILFYYGFNYIRNISINYRLFLMCTLALSGLFVLGLANYSTYWRFSDAGFFIFTATITLWLFQDLKSHKLYWLGLTLLLLFNLLWTTYLFNSYINNGWIFA